MKSAFKPKFFTLIRSGISKKQISNEILAGIVVGIVALPLAIAFAVASGVSPEKGLITAIIAGFIISFLGGSRVQIGGPTGAFIVIVYGIVEKYGVDGLIISTVIAGLFLILFGILKLGTLLKYFPHPLVVGFTSGRIPTAPVNMPLIKGFSIVGVRAGEFGRRDPVKGKENIEAVKKLADEGNLKPHICKTFKLEEAKEAIKFLSERKLVGKVAVVME